MKNVVLASDKRRQRLKMDWSEGGRVETENQITVNKTTNNWSGEQNTDVAALLPPSVGSYQDTVELIRSLAGSETVLFQPEVNRNTQQIPQVLIQQQETGTCSWSNSL